MTRQGPPTLPPRASRGGPRISIVMPTYRRAHQIGEAVASLLAQSFADWELLVRDDGDGTDGTEQAVAAVAAGDPRVRYHRNPQSLRMPGNLNGGILETRGEVVAVCHDHDLYHPRFLAEMLAALDRNPGALFVHCAIEVIAQDGRPVTQHVGEWPELTPGEGWLRVMLGSLSCPVCALTLVRREAHERHGLYDPAYGFISDAELWMRLAGHGDVAYVGQPLIRVREREEGHDANANPIPLLDPGHDLQQGDHGQDPAALPAAGVRPGGLARPAPPAGGAGAGAAAALPRPPAPRRAPARRPAAPHQRWLARTARAGRG